MLLFWETIKDAKAPPGADGAGEVGVWSVDVRPVLEHLPNGVVVVVEGQVVRPEGGVLGRAGQLKQVFLRLPRHGGAPARQQQVTARLKLTPAKHLSAVCNVVPLLF